MVSVTGCGGYRLCPPHCYLPSWIFRPSACSALYFSIFREDVAESIIPWYAWYHKPSTVASSEIESIAALIPNRLNVLSQYLLSGKWAEYDFTNMEHMTMQEPHYIGGGEQYAKKNDRRVL